MTPDAAPRPAEFSLNCEGEWVTAMTATPGGRTLVTGSDKGKVRLWSMEKAPFASRGLKDFPSPVTALRICPAGKSVIAGTWDGVLVRIDLATGKVMRKYEEHRETITALDFSPDGDYLASGSADDRLIVWDAASGEDLLEMHQGNEYDVTTLAFSPDGETLASGDGENEIKLWDANNGEAIRVLKGHREPVSRLVFDSEGTLVSGSWDKTIRVWSKEKSLILKGHAGEITDLKTAGDKLFSAGEDGMVLVWSLQTGKALGIMKGSDSLRCLEVTEKVILAGTKGRVLGWVFGSD